MNMRINSSCREDQTFTGNDLRSGSHDQFRAYPVHDIRISRLTYPADPAVLDSHIRFYDPGVIDDHRICDHSIRTFFVGDITRLPHAVAKGFSAAELRLFSLDRQIFFHFNDK